FFFFLFFFFFLVYFIYITTIVQTMNYIRETQADIKEKEETALKLEQERSELSKSERIKDVAKKQGLQKNGDNVRTVK
ncbi:cell division protein FtsL, partial [Enterococcus faecalis]|uniref:cell division protein FtsL n=1 Tax=Enterococcus faecalis TaxID=1351 RepID=UPI003CC5FB17